MMKHLLLLVISGYCCWGTGSAFVVHPATSRFSGPSHLTAETSDNRKRRVRRKSPVEGNTPEVPQTKSNLNVDFEPRLEDTGVSLKVTDVRDLVRGTTSNASSTPSATSYNTLTTKATTTNSVVEPSKPLDDSLQQLLLDAREMQEKAPTTSDSNNSTIRNAISTLVTVDFFVVCLFLLWFLAGIFCSVVLKDDTVQIAFNSNFQQLVQPALGVLMIAAIADALFKQKEDDDDK
ncbi:hypothetical protein FisN_25Lu152 [Fistulifera solaris]|uniref:Uncharacterized protein n=1 Tax=Fistulifera solaris TaxID=1519565 RepID=A0A1Z5J7Q8_FISSO|nr:hypothetical protein FisN_25Lu152 [Fistulifera solaris]|eukprot:GAX10010.1 hypothetical protein FisN_25Lu152 [Fistulifera solaris]